MMKSKLYREDVRNAAETDLPWEMLSGSRILITGASGMIGTILTDILMCRSIYYKNKIRVVAIGRNELQAFERFQYYWDNEYFSYYHHDVTQPLEEQGDFDYIIHAACYNHPTAYSADPVGTIIANVTSTCELLNYGVKHHIKRFVFLSSTEIYGKSYGFVQRFKEQFCGYLDCNTLSAGYPESKRTGEALCNAFGKSHNLDFVIPRLGKVFGPTMRESDSKALSQFLQWGISGHSIILQTNGLQRYSFCYAADAALAALTILMRGEKGNAYNVADDQMDFTLKEIAKMIGRSTNTRVVHAISDLEELAGNKKPAVSLVDCTKLRKLHWKPMVSFQEGIQRTVSILWELKN